jgi:1-deoxy-D-xylulose-5-phosphate reductoisomerase
MSNDCANPRRVAVLGSTGSIGTNCLDVIASLGDTLSVHSLSAHSSGAALCAQVERHHPRRVALTDPEASRQLELGLASRCEVLLGPEALAVLAGDPEADIVVSAVVGSAGLTGTWAALEQGKTVAFANKETLVMAGPLVMDLARRRGGHLIPVDSEHSAIFQAMRGASAGEVERVVLTGSGGPFRGRTREQLADVTVEDALRHPTWRMGPKISVDSATMMNKALEIIEARWLFDLPPEKIEVIIHPESVIHSFVEFRDGAVLAQLSPPDMRLPIQYALTYPDRVPGPARKLAWKELSGWHFEQPDRETFPALDLGFEVARKGGTCGAVFNAANEAAVGRFLKGELAFLDIVPACRAALDHHSYSPTPTMTELARLDRWARQEVSRWTSPRMPSRNRSQSSPA